MGAEGGFEWQAFNANNHEIGDYVVDNFQELVRLRQWAEFLRRINRQPGAYDTLTQDPKIGRFRFTDLEAIPQPRRMELATAALTDRLNQDKLKALSRTYEGLRRNLQACLQVNGPLFAKLVRVEAVVSGERPIQVRRDTEHKDHIRGVVAIISGGAKPLNWPRLNLDAYQLTPSGPIAKRSWFGSINYVVDVINPRTLEPQVMIEELGPDY